MRKIGAPIALWRVKAVPLLVAHVTILKHGLIAHLPSVEMMRFQITEIIKQVIGIGLL
jgi:hypothetical protein